jgi:hypothetical protein
MKHEHSIIAKKRKETMAVETRNESHFDRMPYELKFSVFSSLPIGDLAKIPRVSTLWHAHAQDNILWKHLIRRDFGASSLIGRGIGAGSNDYKMLYRELFEKKKEQEKQKSVSVFPIIRSVSLCHQPVCLPRMD